MKFKIYVVKHCIDDEFLWSHLPFFASNRERARQLVVKAIVDARHLEPYDVENSDDVVMCIGEYDLDEMSITSYPVEAFEMAFRIRDLAGDVEELQLLLGGIGL